MFYESFDGRPRLRRTINPPTHARTTASERIIRRGQTHSLSRRLLFRKLFLTPDTGLTDDQISDAITNYRRGQLVAKAA